MLNFLILDNKKFDYSRLFLDIDEKILQLSKKSLYNAKYGLGEAVNYSLVDKLLNYKSILSWKLSGSECLCQFDIKEIVARIQRLVYTDGFQRSSDSLTGCTPDQCKPIQNFTVNFK